MRFTLSFLFSIFTQSLIAQNIPSFPATYLKNPSSLSNINNNPINQSLNIQTNQQIDSRVVLAGVDCSSATVLCNTTLIHQDSSMGGFGIQEVTSQNSCWSSHGERRSSWFKFTAKCNGTLTFNITPDDNNVDFDWAIWNTTIQGCPLVNNSNHDAIACNWYGTSGVNGSTGLSASPQNACANENAVDYTPNPTCEPYAFFNSSQGNYNPLTLSAGNTYVLLIDNYFLTNTGFSISFSGTAGFGPDASFSPSNACGNNVTFTKNCSTTNSTFLWNFGDGTFSNIQNPGLHNYAQEGTYSVSLTVTDALGCTSSSTQTITTLPFPNAPFASSVSVCPGNSANLSATTPDGILNWYSSIAGGAILDTGATFTTPPVFTDTLYYVSTFYNGCHSTRTPVNINVTNSVSAFSGPDVTICSGSSISLSGTIGNNANSSFWTTSGSGTFNDSLLQNATYSPSPTDISNGIVSLTLTSNDPSDPCPSDVVNISFRSAPVVFAGPNDTICSLNSYTLAGSGSSNFISWSTSGSGVFSNSSTLSPTYTPSPTDISSGSVTLTINSNDTCGLNTDEMTLIISSAPKANAGSDSVICNSMSIDLIGSTENSTWLSWSTLGSGYFNYPSNDSTIYYPGSGDVINGSVLIILTASNQTGICPISSDTMTLTIIQNTGGNLPFTEGFENFAFPSNGLNIINPDNNFTWERDTIAIAYSGAASSRINNFNNPTLNDSDAIELPALNLTGLPYTPVFQFKYAYAKSDSTISDKLIVFISTNCGQLFIPIFTIEDSTLITDPIESPYIPDNTSNWKTASVSLGAFVSDSNVILRIVNVNSGGNNLYIDNLWIGDTPLQIFSLSKSYDLNVYPNPFNEALNIRISGFIASESTMYLSDLTGKKIREFDQNLSESNFSIRMNLKELDRGIYFLTLEQGGFRIVKKLIKQ